MSQDNIEILARVGDAFNRGDVEAGLRVYASDAEFRDLANAPDQPTVVRGVDAIREVWLQWTAALDEFQVDVEEWTDAGDAVIARVYWHGRGKASGVSIDRRQFDLYELRDGKIVRATLGFGSKEEALRATDASTR